MLNPYILVYLPENACQLRYAGCEDFIESDAKLRSVGGRGCSPRRFGHWALWRYDLPHAQKLHALVGGDIRNKDVAVCEKCRLNYESTVAEYKKMDRKTASTWLILLFLIFVGFGDSFLPKPLSSASLQTRTTINQFFVGLFPSWEPKTNPNARTERALENIEKGGSRR